MPVQRNPVPTRRKPASLTQAATVAPASASQIQSGPSVLSQDAGDGDLWEEVVSGGADSTPLEVSTVGENEGEDITVSQQESGSQIKTGMDKSVAGKSIGKLDENIIRKWEQDTISLSRSSSDTSSEGGYLQGRAHQDMWRGSSGRGLRCSLRSVQQLVPFGLSGHSEASTESSRKA